MQCNIIAAIFVTVVFSFKHTLLVLVLFCHVYALLIVTEKNSMLSVLWWFLLLVFIPHLMLVTVSGSSYVTDELMPSPATSLADTMVVGSYQICQRDILCCSAFLCE